METPLPLLLLLLLFAVYLHVVSCVTDSQDGSGFPNGVCYLHYNREDALNEQLKRAPCSYSAVALNAYAAAAIQSLKDSWQNLPPSWTNSNDPCGEKWKGISCINSRVTALSLSSMGLNGTLSANIAALTALLSLDLSFNPGLTGSIPPTIGNMTNLNILILAGCGFTGEIPEALGNLSHLSFLALNSNYFVGEIPSSLGKLSSLYWLDLADNLLSGPLPVSPGLDQLLNAKHFHLYKNKISGTIPPALFSSKMALIHVLLDENQLIGTIPSTLGLVNTIEVIRLGSNSLSGQVPSNLNNLTSLIELNLANNRLTGPLPDLIGMDFLTYVNLSNNMFDPSEVPVSFSTLRTLAVLTLENGVLEGPVPDSLFNLPQLRQVKLSNNKLNGTFNLGISPTPQLALVDLQFNNISSVIISSANSSTTIKLYGNPICSSVANLSYCQP